MNRNWLRSVAALLLQLSVSRSREFSADALGAQLAGDPLALARALRTIQARTVELPLLPTGPVASASHLMIVNPVQLADLCSKSADSQFRRFSRRSLRRR